ncbi:MAG: fimbrillin family protein [Bacteroides sp.]|nr:fimbrillin family protein [Bacteroides sp.]
MKMRKFFYIGAALWAFGLAGCNNDNASVPEPTVDPESPEDKVAINLSASLIYTRVVDDHWDAQDEIGISMFQPDSREVAEGSFNREYITSTTYGNFQPVNSATTIYFPQDGSHVSFKAYYPYMSSLGTDMEYPVSVASQTNLPSIDLMTSEMEAETYSRATPNVVLTFHHRLSKLVFHIEFEEDFFTLDGGTLVMQGMKTQGSYDLYEDVLSVDDTSVADVQVPLTAGDNMLTGKAIVLPRDADSGISFRITTAAGETFTAQMDDDLDLLSGYRYTFTIILRKTGLFIIKTTIEDWTEGETSELEAS